LFLYAGKLEADDAPLSLVYHYYGELYKQYNDQNIKDKVKKRLQFLFTEATGLSYMLTPKHAAEGFYFDEDQTDIMTFAKKIALKKNLDSADLVEAELIAFVTKMSTLPTNRAEIVFRMSAKDYWNTVGRRDFPWLYEIAKPISEMICSSATAERTWSTFKFIHSRLRNRLTNERVSKLVFLYANSVNLDENDKNDYILEDGAVLTGNDYEESFVNE
jgi:hAT family C-terminal dimerisation region